jgi:hypothetical protein
MKDIVACCAPDKRCPAHVNGVSLDDRTIKVDGFIGVSKLVISPRTARVCGCSSSQGAFGCNVSIRGIVWILDQMLLKFLDNETEYSFCVNAWCVLSADYLILIETWPGPYRVRIENWHSAVAHNMLKDCSNDLLFGLLGARRVLRVGESPVRLEWYRARAIRHQNQLRRELLGPVVQLATRWGLGRDVCRLILNAAAPRLRR